MKIVVDLDLCEGNARCSGVAPDVFEVREDDKSYVINPNPPADRREAIENAVRLCPRQAISIEE